MTGNKDQQPSNTDNGELKHIHTFQSDVEEVMKRQQISKATIAIAQSERRAAQKKEEARAPAPEPQAPSKVFHIVRDLPVSSRWNVASLALIAITLLFLVGTGVGLYFFLSGSETAGPPKEVTQAPKSAAVTLEGKEGRTGIIKMIQRRLDTLSVPQNELHTIPVTLAAMPITTAELFGKLETASPGPLVRALGASPTLGVHGFRGGQPFFLWSVSSYDHAFAGMLAWEPDLLSDIGPLFGISPRAIIAKQLSSTTADVLGMARTFKDLIVRNKDVRAVFGPKGSIIFLYAFIDKETLVLTTNEETLKFLIGRAGGGRLK